MPIVKEVSDYLRKRIFEILVKECPAGRFAEINVPFPTVGSIICKFKQHGTTIILTQSGVPRKINARGSRILHKKVKNNPMITREELKNDVKAAGTSASSRTIIRELHSSNIISFKPRKIHNS